MSRKVELLAPAGNRESFMAALENGADAIYIGAQSLSARHYADNFSPEEIKDAIDQAHSRGVNVYVTVNTLIKDSEMDHAIDLIHELYIHGVDAIIVQDLGLLYLLREKMPDLPVHASTQMNIHNTESIRFLQETGVDRVILAREMNLDEIHTLKKNTGMDIEVFVHGAICFSYSGQCLMSSMIGGRSGNRGHCAQPCRRKYRLRNKGENVETDGEYLLSTGDLCTATILPQLIEAGIDSFKIEGRMKKAEYVAGVVRIYRRLIDRYMEDPENYFVQDSELEELTQLFNRDFSTGYLIPGEKLLSIQRPYNRGMIAGEVIGYNRQRSSIRISLCETLRLKDGIGIEYGCDDVGLIVYKMYENGKPVDKAKSGSVVEIPSDHVLKSGTVYRTMNNLLINDIRSTYMSPAKGRKVPVTIEVSAIVGEPLKIQVKDMDSNRVYVHSEYIIERARTKPTDKSQIEDIMKGLGNTIFEPENVIIKSGDDIFIPLGQLKNTRNQAIRDLTDIRVKKWRRGSVLSEKYSQPVIESKHKKDTEKWIDNRDIYLSVLVNSLQDMKNSIYAGVNRIYFAIDSQHSLNTLNLDDMVQYAHSAGCSIYFHTPRITREDDMEMLHKIFSYASQKADGVLVSNPGTFRIAKEFDLPVIADYPMNIFNTPSLKFILQKGACSTVLSPELTMEQIEDIAQNGSVECIVHSKMTLIESECCVISDIFGSDGCKMLCRDAEFEIVDEKGYSFPLRFKSKCRTSLLNSRTLCMLDHIPDIIKAGVSGVIIDARDLDENLKKTVKLYRKVIDNTLAGPDQVSCILKGSEYTTGHYLRGVL